MAVETAAGAMAPTLAFALVGALGVGAQWLAWRLRMPAIVLMLGAGLLVGPVFGLFDPARDIGPLTGPLISIAVAVILFEGGLTLNFHTLSGAAKGVMRLVVLGAPLGWLFSALTLHYVAGLSWASSAVFGGIMIVTGPTVIAPLLRTARLKRRPAALLQWEAIVNDPVGALAAVLAFEVVVVTQTAVTAGAAARELPVGIVVATVLGLAAGFVIARSFKRAWVPEYMKVPVLFVSLLAVFAVSDAVLHESGLLAVTIMGLWIANAGLPSYGELLRFKEHATILLVSGVFILLAASLDFATLGALNWRALAFVATIVLIARPAAVLLSLALTDIPWNERLMVALTGPRGVVLVAVAGLFGERLAQVGIADGSSIGPLAFVLVAATVVLHGFTLAPMARWLGLTASETQGVLFVGGSRFSTEFARVLQERDFPVLITDPNHAHLRHARRAGVPTFYGDVLAEAVEHGLNMARYGKLLAVTDNDAYNTLVATEMGPELGRDNVFQFARYTDDSTRHALPVTLGGRVFRSGDTYFDAEKKLREGWRFRVTGLTEEFGFDDWKSTHPEAHVLAEITRNGALRLLSADTAPSDGPDVQLIAFGPPRDDIEAAVT